MRRSFALLAMPLVLAAGTAFAPAANGAVTAANPACSTAQAVTTCRFQPVVEKTTTSSWWGIPVVTTVTRDVTVVTTATLRTTTTTRTTAQTFGGTRFVTNVQTDTVKEPRTTTPTPAPSPTATTPAPSPTTPAPSPTATTPAPSPTATTPAPSPTATTPAPSPTATTPAPSPTATTPAPSPTATTPAPTPSPTRTTPAPSPTATTPAPSPTRTTPAPSPTATTPAPQDFVAATETRIFELTNAERVKAGLKPFGSHQQVSAVARDWSQTMLRTGAFQHRPDWKWLDGISGWTNAAENIYMCGGCGSSADSAARAAVTGWMNSAGHRANILNPQLTHLGVGIAKGGSSVYATQNFVGLR